MNSRELLGIKRLKKLHPTGRHLLVARSGRNLPIIADETPPTRASRGAVVPESSKFTSDPSSLCFWKPKSKPKLNQNKAVANSPSSEPGALRLRVRRPPSGNGSSGEDTASSRTF